jgi:hypothetical protein
VNAGSRPESRHVNVRPGVRWTVVSAMALVLASMGLAAPAGTSSPGSTSTDTSTAPAASSGCSAGAHTLGTPGDRLYPDTGNGGYTSVHTNVNMVYDATTNLFLPGNNVALTDLATQCLTSFSLDFERTSADTVAGPDMTVGSVKVNGKPATFTFVQPTYPGDPAGQDDPNPAAHEASQTDPVGGPDHNQLPPACSPERATPAVPPDSLDGTQCPANKLVITPANSIPSGASFTVVVNYTGRPGIHHDGDGTTEGWFRSSDGGFVTTEPVGSEDWMPLNDFPTAKPTYDFYDTVGPGLTAVANGELLSTTPNPADAEFPQGSTTWHWTSGGAPVASYLVEDSVGYYTLSQRLASDEIMYYEAQDASIPAKRQKLNLKIMNQQQNITDFEAGFNGAFPFTSDGVVVGSPVASFEEEMQTMITFAGGKIGTATFYHENMHQWWGDHVTEAGYNMTFYKEGLATLAEYLYYARQKEDAAGGPGSPAGRAAFRASLVAQFNATYDNGGGYWDAAPSNPTPASLFGFSLTYGRPGAAYLALRQILGPTNFDKVLVGIQSQYGGGNIDETQLEAAFHQGMPNQSSACSQELNNFGSPDISVSLSALLGRDF